MPRKDNFAATRRPRPKGASLSKKRTAMGTAWPILFGIRRTALLMYVATHPGCMAGDVLKGTGMSFIQWTHAREFLQHHDLLIGDRYEYHINPALKNREDLVRFLRALARARGMRRTRAGYRVNVLRDAPKHPKIRIPPALFYGQKRLDVLLVLASINECYSREVGYAASMTEANAASQLRHLQIEGLVRSRRSGRATVWEMDAGQPGYVHLRRLLRSMASTTPDILAGLSRVLLRRRAIVLEQPRNVADVVRHLKGAPRAIRGANKKTAAAAYAQMRRILGKK